MATLSYASDLGLGQPMAHCMRQTVVALRLAGLAGASGRELEATYYLGLMMNVYCHADASEQARWFGDDITMKSDTFDLLDMSTARMVAFMVRRVGSHGSGVARARRLAAFPVAGVKQVLSFATTHCTLGSQFAEQVGLDEAVCVAIRQGYEQWDGKGYPGHLRGEEICLPARLVALAGPVEVVARRRGAEAAVAVARRHRGTQFDPAVVDLFCARAPELLDGLDQASDWDAVLGTEPELSRRVSGAGLDQVLEALADLVDMKSPYLAGHSRGVANLAGAAARAAGYPGDDVAVLRRAGLIHDLGRLGVSNAIWDKPGPLTGAESERIRLHPYLTDRMLARVDALEPQPGDRRPAPRAARWLRLPAGADRSVADAAGPAAGRRGRLPRDDRAAAVPGSARPRPGRARAAGRGRLPGGWTARLPKPCWRPRAIACRPGEPGPAGLPHGRSRSSGCWPAATRPGTSPRRWWSRRRRRPTTSSTSTASSAYPPAPPRRSTPPSTA